MVMARAGPSSLVSHESAYHRNYEPQEEFRDWRASISFATSDLAKAFSNWSQ